MEHLQLEIPDLLRDDLPTEDRERIQRHLAVCPSCRGEWESIEVLAGPQRRHRPSVPQGYFATLPSRILEKRQQPARTPWVRPLAEILRPAIPLAAGALVIFALLRSSTPATVSADRLPVEASEAAEYLSTDPAVLSVDLVQAAEPLLSDRALMLGGRNAQETGLEDLEPNTVSEVVAELDESEIDQLISKLSERAIL